MPARRCLLAHQRRHSNTLTPGPSASPRTHHRPAGCPSSAGWRPRLPSRHAGVRSHEAACDAPLVSRRAERVDLCAVCTLVDASSVSRARAHACRHPTVPLNIRKSSTNHKQYAPRERKIHITQRRAGVGGVESACLQTGLRRAGRGSSGSCTPAASPSSCTPSRACTSSGWSSPFTA